MKQRKRQLDPDFFHNEKLCKLDPFARLLFAGLWTIADREGLLKDTPDVIKGLVFPFDKKVNVDNLIKQLADNDFIVRYSLDGGNYIWIKSFKEHQPIHPNEKKSVIKFNDNVIKLHVKQTQGHCGQNVDVEENVDINIKEDIKEEVEQSPKPKTRSKAQRWNDGQIDLINKEFDLMGRDRPDIKDVPLWLKWADRSVGLVIIGLKQIPGYEKRESKKVDNVTGWLRNFYRKRSDRDIDMATEIDRVYEVNFKTKVGAVSIGDIMKGK